MVGSADGCYLFEMMLAVDQMEPAPLGDIERAEYRMGCTFARWPEEILGFRKEQIQVSQVIIRRQDQLFA